LEGLAMIRHFANWLSMTWLSELFQNQLWVIPTSQSIHIVSVGFVFGSAAMISLRLLGIGNSGRSVSQLTATLVPWMYRALCVLLFTGTVQTIAEPMRQFVTPAFWWKMFMIVCVVLLTVWFSRSVRANAHAWDTAKLRPHSATVFALVSLSLWVGIIFCGRFIGYTWLFHV
jgi:hypothetical protein